MFVLFPGSAAEVRDPEDVPSQAPACQRADLGDSRFQVQATRETAFPAGSGTVWVTGGETYQIIWSTMFTAVPDAAIASHIAGIATGVDALAVRHLTVPRLGPHTTK